MTITGSDRDGATTPAFSTEQAGPLLGGGGSENGTLFFRFPILLTSGSLSGLPWSAMKTPSPEALTTLLAAWSRGDVAARDQLLPLVYDELRRRAAKYLRGAKAGQTLQTTSLVHEAYLRMSTENAGWKNSAHFFAVASQVMRWILVDHARARQAAKRLVTMMTVAEEADSQPRALDIISIDEALNELAMADPQQAQMVELRFFGGLTHEEVASTLGVSLRTVKRQWRLARAWLHQRVAQERVN